MHDEVLVLQVFRERSVNFCEKIEIKQNCEEEGTDKQTHTRINGLGVVVVVLLVVLVRARCTTHVCLHVRQRVHLIGATERLGVRLAATPPLREPSMTKNSSSSRARKLSTHVQPDGVRKMPQYEAKN